MKRHAALVPLSHDHHHALVEARRLRTASALGPEERLAAARHFCRFFRADTTSHLREEEELLFPLLASEPPELTRALHDHVRLHGLVRSLGEAVARGAVSPDELREIGELLERHVRLEERELFPLIEAAAADELALPERPPDFEPIASEELNASLVAWGPGEASPEHGNDERDVLYVCLGGRGVLVVDGRERPLAEGAALVVPKGAVRQVIASAWGIRYLTAHRRRPGLQIGRVEPR